MVLPVNTGCLVAERHTITVTLKCVGPPAIVLPIPVFVVRPRGSTFAD